MRKFLKVLVAILFIALTATAQTWEIGYPNPADVIAVLYEDGTMRITGVGKIKDFVVSWDSVSDNITNIIIEDGITIIENSAFRCKNLISVTIPNSVTAISSNVFMNCRNLTEINVATDNPNFSSDNGVLFNKDKTELIMYPTGRQGAYVIPNSVTHIKECAFRGNLNLTSVTIPNSVTFIGASAFEDCQNLTSVTIPNSVTFIGGEAFRYTALTSIIIPSSVTHIGYMAFVSNTPFTEIISLATIPPQTSVGNFLFNADETTPVYVPINSVPFYRMAEGWRNLTNIIGIANEVQVIWGQREFEFNLMPQYPDFRLEPADIINTNHLIVVNGYNVVAGRYRPELQIRDEFRHLYQGVRLVGASVEYEITRRPLNVVMRDQNGNRRDTITTEENIRTSGDLFDYIESILDFSNFATDTINNRTDDESVLRGKPRIGIQNDDSQRSLRNNGVIIDRNINLSIGERFLVTVMTDSISADNYRVLGRNIAITIDEGFITLSTDPRDNITSIANVRKTDNRYGIKLAQNPVSDKAEISVILPNNEKAIETKIAIYDMTGNVVFSTTVRDNASWDLRNSAGRFVANGTYLVIAEVKDRNGRTHAYSARLGVKR